MAVQNARLTISFPHKYFSVLMLPMFITYAMLLQLSNMHIILGMQRRSNLFLWNYIRQNFSYLRIWLLQKRTGNAFTFMLW